MRLFFACAFTLFFALCAQAQETLSWLKTGTIGDSAPKARIYEIDGHYCTLPADAVVITSGGSPFDIEKLRGGHRVTVHGYRTTDDNGLETITVEKMQVLNP